MTDTRNESLQQIIEGAWSLSPEIGVAVDDVIADSPEPISDDAYRAVVTRIVDAIRATPAYQQDRAAMNDLTVGVDQFVTSLLVTPASPEAEPERVVLEGRDGVVPGPVFPAPVFHKRPIPMNGGFVRAKDIGLWSANERLQIHLSQFRRREGRGPRADEMLDIMLSRLTLPGIDVQDKSDQFKIWSLARSVAASGVRVPPIIDIDGTLLDGNRRFAACMLILLADDFTHEEKRRAEWIFVHQLTDHATDADRDAVVVACNFEPANKEEWPEYVKARKVAEAFQERVDLQPTYPNRKEQQEMKKELSRRFGLGPDSSIVSRYLKMVQWADSFELHHVGKRGRDEYEVKHRASKYFQYFDELSKGQSPGKVAYTLESDDKFRETVYDLLFDGKFRNWRQIRDLKDVHKNEDAMKKLADALEEDDVDEGQRQLDDAVAIARLARAEARALGADTRIEQFTKFLFDLPLGAFSSQIKPDNLRRLRDALVLVDHQARKVLGDDG